MTLKNALDLAGPDLRNVQKVAEYFKSTRTIAQLLEKWQDALSLDETTQLKDCHIGVISPGDNDKFLGLVLLPSLTDAQVLCTKDVPGLCRSAQ